MLRLPWGPSLRAPPAPSQEAVSTRRSCLSTLWQEAQPALARGAAPTTGTPPETPLAASAARRWVGWLLAALLAVSPGTGVAAEPGGPEGASAGWNPAPTAPPAAPPALAPALDEQVWRAPVAPGIDLLAVRRLDGEGWLDLFALLVDLATPGVGVQALTPAAVTSRERTSELVRQAGASGGINGDFFYLGATDAPVGLVVREGALWKGPDPFGRPTLAILETPQGPVARIGTWRLSARAVAADGVELTLDGWNESAVRPGQVMAFDERWGSTPLPLTRAWATELAYARLRGAAGEPGEWEVVEAGRGPTGPPGPGERVLLGWRDGAQRLLAFAARGGRVRLELRLQPADGSAPEGTLAAAVSGGGWLIRGGQPAPAAPTASPAPGSAQTPQPRAAAGVDRSGRRLVLAVADGRRPTSRGLTVDQLTLWLLRLGAWDALYLDGGGSATLVADLTGRGPVVVNRPAGGEERAVPVALGVFYHPQSGPMAPFVLRPAFGVQAPDPEGYRFDFAGLLSAPGIPVTLETFPPADPGSLVWSVDPPDLGYFDAPGQFVGLREGEGHIVATRALQRAGSWQQASGRTAGDGAGGDAGRDPVARAAAAFAQRWAAVASIPVRVIGQPVALEIDPSPVEVAEGVEVALRVRVRDRLGRAAPVAPAHVTFWVDGPASARVQGGLLRVERVWGDAPLWLQARYVDLKATVPIRVVGRAGAPAAGWGEPNPPDRPPPQELVGAGAGRSPSGPLSRSGGDQRPPAMAPAEPAEQVAPGLRVLLLPHGAVSMPDSASPDLTVVMATDEEAAQQAPAGEIPGRSAVLAVRVSSGAANLSAFVQRFGWPNAVATRGATRFLSLDPSLRPWAWLDGELRRAKAQGVRRLVVFSGEPPGQWPLRREGEMVHGWLAETAREGLEVWWLHGDPAVPAVRHLMRDGVHYLAVPRPGLAHIPPPQPLWLVVSARGVQVQALARGAGQAALERGEPLSPGDGPPAPLKRASGSTGP